MRNKRGFEFSFVWLFAIIVGAFILFLAIYSAVRVIKGGSYEIGTLTAKQFVNVFETVETGLASGVRASAISLKDETIIFNRCYEEGSFGRQKISLASKILGSWQEESARIDVPNKYIFSNTTEQGKKVYYFSKPFEMPFKVSEIIFLSTRSFCFVNAPDEIEEDASFLMANLDSNCSPNSIRVCFGSGNCEIKVKGLCTSNCNSNYDYGSVTKQGKTVFYTGNLIYGAIFSSADVYECNVKRLMKRLGNQADLLKKEADFLTGRCEVQANELIKLSVLARNLKKSEDLLSIKKTADDAERESLVSECNLW